MWRVEPREHSVLVYLIGKEQRRHLPKYFETLLEEDCVLWFLFAQRCVEILKHGILSNMKTRHVLRLRLFCFVFQERIVWEKLLCLHFLERLLTWNSTVLFVYRKNCTAAKMYFILLQFYPAKKFYMYFHRWSRFSLWHSLCLKCFILLCMTVFVCCMAVKLKPNKSASVVKTGICSTCNNCPSNPLL